tara:strand:- start:285 stop:437 length:153 start_codon:yes stop_codon:yes gene_type:complete
MTHKEDKWLQREERIRKAAKKKYYAKYNNRKSLEVIIQAKRNRMEKILNG